MSFFEVLTAAVADLVHFGFDSAERLQEWLRKLKDAAQQEAGTDKDAAEQLRQSLRALYGRYIDKGQILKYHPGVSIFTLKNIEPRLRAVLDRRILASAGLIKINREQAIEKTLQRFSGWATSIPAGGSKQVDKREVKSHVAKTLRQMNYEERRLYIDQGHKMMANISAVVAEQSGAIAAKWRHVHEKGYNGRPDHEKRDGEWFVVRDTWATEKSFMQRGPYTDSVDQPSELPFCRCWFEYADSLLEVPDELLTKAGRDAKHQPNGAAPQ